MTVVSTPCEGVIPFTLSDGPKTQVPLPAGVEDGGRTRGEGGTLAEGWAHLGEAQCCVYQPEC